MIDKDGNIVVDRSGVETRLLCKQKRYLSRDYDTTGITSPAGRYEADFGQALHTELHRGMVDKAGMDANKLSASVYEAVQKNLAPFKNDDHARHTRREQSCLASLLVRKWLDVRWPLIQLDHRLIEAEREQAVVFDPHVYLPKPIAGIMRPVKMLFRPDTIFERSDGMIFSMDFKTASRAGDDWSIHHSQSLQTYLYSAAMREIYGDKYGGIWYEGLVKGYREVDNARSSKYQGYTIQYGSPLYAWYKNGKKCKYVSGAQRDFAFERDNMGWRAFVNSISPEELLITTLPSNPHDTALVVGQMIVNENAYQADLDIIQECPVGSPQRQFYEQVIIERNFHACYKYGAKHPCEFVRICHGGPTREEIQQEFIPRVPHHTGEQEQQ